MKRYVAALVCLAVFFCSRADASRRELLSLSSDSLMNMGRSLSDDPEKAFLCFSVVDNRYPEPRNLTEATYAASAINNCGHLLFHSYEDYSRAYTYFSRADALAGKWALDSLKPIVSLNLGNLYLTYANRHKSKSETQTALDYYRQGFSAAVAKGYDELAVLNFTNLCAICLDDLETDTLPDEIPAFERHRFAPSTRGLAYAGGLCKALRMLRRGDYDGARRIFLGNLNHIDARYSPERYEYAAYAFVARTFRRQNMPDSALAYNLKIEELTRRYHLPDVKPDTYRELSEIMSEMGRKDEADRYRALFLEAKDSLLAINNLDDVGRLRLLDSLYRADSEMKRMQQRQRFNQIAIWGGAILLLIIVAALLLALRQNRRLNLKNRELYNKNVEILKAESERASLRRRIDDTGGANPGKYRNSPLGDSDKDLLSDAITEVFTRPEVYCDTDFSIDTLAQLVNSKTKYVSQVINERFGHGFSQLLSDSRVKEACRRINGRPEYLRLTIEAIAHEVGFKSRVTFLTAFTRVTGLTPSQYRRMASK